MGNFLFLFLIGIILWIYAFFSTLTNEFENNTNKIVWILLLIFLPVSAFIYPFFGKPLIKGESGIETEDVVMYFMLLISGISSSLLLGKIKVYYNIDSSQHFGYIGGIVILLATTFLVFFLFSFIYGFLESFFNKNIGKSIIKILLSLGVIFVLCGTIYNIYSDKMEEKRITKLNNFNIAKNLFDQKKYKESFDIFNLYPNEQLSYEYLGKMYYYGEGVEQQYVKAFSLFNKIENKNPIILELLGNMNYYGQGTKINYAKAINYYTESNTSISNLSLGYIYYLGEVVIKNYEKSFKHFQNAANTGNKRAYKMLARMYEDGFGVEKNKILAKKYFLLSK